MGEKMKENDQMNDLVEKPKVVLSRVLLDKLLMRPSAFISMLKSKRPSSEVAERAGVAKKTIQQLRKKFAIEVK